MQEKTSQTPELTVGGNISSLFDDEKKDEDVQNALQP